MGEEKEAPERQRNAIHGCLQGDQQIGRGVLSKLFEQRPVRASVPAYSLPLFVDSWRNIRREVSLSVLPVDFSQKRDLLLILLISSFHICMLIF